MDNVIAVRGGDISLYCGVYVERGSGKEFWRIECPCGVVQTYPVNKLPEVDTQHPCGNPKHWTVKYEV